jgi:cephalosporin hydroxylase
MLKSVGNVPFVKRARRRFRNLVFDRSDWNYSRRKFLDQAPRSQTAEEAVDFVMAYRGKGFYKSVAPYQNTNELKHLIRRVQELQPRTIVEIGTCHGGTLIALALANPLLELLVSLDLPHGQFGGGYLPQRGKLYRLVEELKPNCRVELMRVDSHAQSSFERLRQVLNGRPIDFLFIDGDHTYEGVRQDYLLYKPLVRSGGLIAFHDIYPNPQDPNIQVHKLWMELMPQPATEEIRYEPTEKFGIGVIEMP